MGVRKTPTITISRCIFDYSFTLVEDLTTYSLILNSQGEFNKDGVQSNNCLKENLKNLSSTQRLWRRTPGNLGYQPKHLEVQFFILSLLFDKDIVQCYVLGTTEYVQVVAWHLTRLVIQFHGPFVSALVRAVLLRHNFFY